MSGKVQLQSSPKVEFRLMDYPIRLTDLFEHLDASTSEILYALAYSVEREKLSDYDDVKVQAIREVAEKIAKIEIDEP